MQKTNNNLWLIDSVWSNYKEQTQFKIEEIILSIYELFEHLERELQNKYNICLKSIAE